MTPWLRAMLVTLVLVCAGLRPGAAESQQPVAPATGPTPTAAPMECDTWPAAGAALGALRLGQTAYDRVAGFGDAKKGTELELTPLFPRVAERFRVYAATPADLVPGGPREYVLLLTGATETRERFAPAATTWLAVAACAGNAGYALRTEPLAIATEQAVNLLSATQIEVPGGGLGLSLLILQATPSTMELQENLFVLGPELATRQAKALGGGLALLGIGDNYGAQILQPRPDDPAASGLDYWRQDVRTGSGWLRLGTDLAYVALRTDSSADNAASLAVLALLSRTGWREPTAQPWLLLGKGAAPAWCGPRPPQITCTTLDPADRDWAGDLPYTWIAGAWATPKEALAALAAVHAKPTVGTWYTRPETDAPPAKAPGGGKALTQLRWKAKAGAK